jgi:alpha,alpha-trehalase
MEYFLEHWDKFKESWNDRYVILFLDYDGTLTPITKTPDQAFLPEENKRLLQELTKLSSCQLVVISGRAVADVKNRVGVEDIIYIGNHGFEIDGPKFNLGWPAKGEFLKVLDEIRDDLNKEFVGVRGVIVEDKGWSLSVHYRLVDEKDLNVFNMIFNRICTPYLAKEQIRIHTGKKVFEVRPSIEWDKGTVVRWFLNRRNFDPDSKKVLPVYIGDDQTDEDAFQALKSAGVTIRVERSEISEAKYFLKDTKEVSLLLEKILELRTV